MKLKKRKKSTRFRGRRTCGFSAKLHKGKGSKGGKGMSGTGKRADQKKTWVLNKYKIYFGKQGITSKGTAKRYNPIINLLDIERKYKEGGVDLSKYKILGEGEVSKKFIIKAKAASESAIAKVKKAGGEIILEPSLKKEASGRKMKLGEPSLKKESSKSKDFDSAQKSKISDTSRRKIEERPSLKEKVKSENKKSE